MAVSAGGTRSHGLPRRWLDAGLGLVKAGLLGVAGASGALRRVIGPSVPVLPPTVAVTRGAITARVDGIGTVGSTRPAAPPVSTRSMPCAMSDGVTCNLSIGR